MLLIKEMDRDPVFDLIPISMLKEHIRQLDEYEDELIEAYYLAAINYSEKYTNRFFTETNMLGYQERYSKKIYIPYDVTEITKVTAKNSAGTTIEITDFTFNQVTSELILDNSYTNYTDIEINFVTGYKEGCVPPAILQGIMMIFATTYEVREDVSYGVSANSVPFRSTMMLDMYKNYLSV